MGSRFLIPILKSRIYSIGKCCPFVWWYATTSSFRQHLKLMSWNHPRRSGLSWWARELPRKDVPSCDQERSWAEDCEASNLQFLFGIIYLDVLWFQFHMFNYVDDVSESLWVYNNHALYQIVNDLQTAAHLEHLRNRDHLPWSEPKRNLYTLFLVYQPRILIYNDIYIICMYG